MSRITRSAVFHGKSRLLTAAFCAALIAAGCSSGAATTTTSTSPASGPTTSAPTGSSAPSTTTEPQTTTTFKTVTVKIGLNRNLLFLPVWVAKEKDFFSGQGIDAQFTELSGGSELRTAILGGSTDFTVQVPEGSALLYVQGEHLVNVVATQKKLGWKLIIRTQEKDQVKTVADLKGKVIGVSGRGAGSDVQLQALLRSANLVPDKDVKIVAIGAYSAGIEAMRAGQIDGMMIVEPATSQALSEGVGYVLADWSAPDFKIYPGVDQVPFGSLAAMQSYIDAHPDVVERVVRAVVQAEQYMVDNPDWTVQYAATLTSTDASLIDGAVRNGLLPNVGPQISEVGWNALVKALQGAGVITEDVPYQAVTDVALASVWDEFKP